MNNLDTPVRQNEPALGEDSTQICKKSQTVVDKIFDLRGGFAIVALTGRTGSGCTTVAELLTKNFKFLSLPRPVRNATTITNEDRKYRICYDYLEKHWNPAIHIKVTHLIVWICLQNDFDTLICDLEQWYISNIALEHNERKETKLREGRAVLRKHNKIFKTRYTEIHADAKRYYEQLQNQQYKKKHNSTEHEQVTKALDEFLNTTLPKYYISLKDEIAAAGLSFVEIFQLLGNYIRESGFDGSEHHSIIRLVNYLIKFYRNKENSLNKKVLIVIDALRNPYEVLFLRERYSAFYLMSINTPEKERKQRLFDKSYTQDQISDCDKTEFPKKPSLRETYIYQNIEKCIEISDIHIVNTNDNHYRHNLKKQLVHYISLMHHPGLITPSNEERVMQIAHTAKHSSGCISRQVGAAITDENFAIKSIGWNDVPEGQTQCILRNGLHLIEGNDTSAYSSYELNESEFHDKLKKKITNAINTETLGKLSGRNISYCFKDIYNNKEKGENNQVHTRSLHAEENAFLQIVKYGGQGIKGGKLFTTASPCELCAKKAYQLGIKEIYYIDQYPGISQKHILNCGSEKPVVKLFQGAIGRAYIHLYQPIIPYKDEIYDKIGFNPKQSSDESLHIQKQEQKNKGDELPSDMISTPKPLAEMESKALS